VAYIRGLGVYSANHDARAALTGLECGACTRLDRINAKKPARLLDSRSLTLRFWFRQIWPVFFMFPGQVTWRGTSQD
jgi:hypothetical protein